MNTLQNWFLNLAGRGERYLFGLTLAALGLLAISQLLMANGKVRYYMNRVEFLEGEPYPVPSWRKRRTAGWNWPWKAGRSRWKSWSTGRYTGAWVPRE